MTISFPNFSEKELSDFFAQQGLIHLQSEHSSLVFFHQKEITQFFGKQVFDLLFAESTRDYFTARSEFAGLIQHWKSVHQPDFCATRVRSSNVAVLHSLLQQGFYPVEVLLHLFYPIPPSLILTDELTSDIVPYDQEDIPQVTELLKRNQITTHIHHDPHLPGQLGDLALEYYVSRLVGKPGSVVAKRKGEVVGFFALAPRQVPYPGKEGVLELLIGALSREISSRFLIARDLLSVLYPRLASGKNWLEIRIPDHLFSEATELLEQKPAHLETSVVLHYLKDVSG